MRIHHSDRDSAKRAISFALGIARVGLSGLTLLVTASCSTAHRADPGPISATSAGATIVTLRNSLLATRTQIDTMVAQLHRLTSQDSPESIRRSIELVRRIESVDSTYRLKLADYLWVTGRQDDGLSAGSKGFPINLPPSPLLQPFSDGEDWMLQSPMIYMVGKSRPLIIIVPRGFVTDFLSIPRPLRLLLPKKGDYDDAAVVHDYLYWRQDCTRAQSDNIMARGMVEAGIPSATLTTIELGVRIGGESGWDSNRRDRRAGLMRTVGPPLDQVPVGATWEAYRDWIRAHGGSRAVEYPVPKRICEMADN